MVGWVRSDNDFCGLAAKCFSGLGSEWTYVQLWCRANSLNVSKTFCTRRAPVYSFSTWPGPSTHCRLYSRLKDSSGSRARNSRTNLAWIVRGLFSADAYARQCWAYSRKSRCWQRNRNSIIAARLRMLGSAGFGRASVVAR